LASSLRTRGTMLWFNAAKDAGALRTEDGERIEVLGDSFLPGEKPIGRCAGRPVEFDALDGTVAGLSFVEDMNPRRARSRGRRAAG
jgi:hypothetical protein